MYNKYWFNEEWLHKNGTYYDDKWFDKNWLHKNGTFYDYEGYDEEGYDEEGYDKEGYHWEGYDREWYDRSWFYKDWFDKNWYNKWGIDRKWFDRNGYNEYWYNQEWYDREWFSMLWFNKKWIHRNGSLYDAEWYDCEGFGKNWFSREGFDKNWFNKKWFNLQKFHKNGTLYDDKWYDIDWFDTNWFDKKGFNKKGFDIYDIDVNWYHRDGRSFQEFLMKMIESWKWNEAQKIYTLRHSYYSKVVYWDDIMKIFLQKYFKKSPDFYPFLPSSEQQAVIVDMSQNLLVKARAGSGKTTTMVWKTHFLHHALGVPTDKIAFIAFNRSAVADLKQKCRDKNFWEFQNAFTFHSLAGKINNALDIYKNNEDEDRWKLNVDFIIRFVLWLHEENLSEKQLENRERVLTFLREEDFEKFQESAEMDYKYQREVRNTSSVYKSLSRAEYSTIFEKWIADYLFEYDYCVQKWWVSYYQRLPSKTWKQDWSDKREFSFLVNLSEFTKPKKSQEDDPFGSAISLDEWENILPKILIIDVAKSDIVSYRQSFFEKYYDAVYLGFDLAELREKFWKKQWPRKEFENFFEKCLCDVLIERLWEKFVAKEKLAQEVLWGKIEKWFRTTIEAMVENYISRAKQRRFSVQDMMEKSRKYKDIAELSAFYDFANECFEEYEKMLKQQNSQDYNDILRMAIDRANEEKRLPIIYNAERISIDLSQLEYLIVDEFQDVSMLFYELIEVLRDYNPRLKVICVGDDWQRINSFAGSEGKYIEKFENFFPNARILSLNTTRRTPVEIIEEVEEFTKNATGMKTEKSWGSALVISLAKNEDKYRIDVEGDHNAGYIFRDGDGKKVETSLLFRKMMKIIAVSIAQLMVYKKTTGKDFLILTRNNYCMDVDFGDKKLQENFCITLGKLILEEYSVLTNVKISPDTREKFCKQFSERIKIMTAHKSKWGEADFVFLLEHGKNWCVLHPNWKFWSIFGDTKEENLQEEKRLYYVAITRAREWLFCISEHFDPKLAEPYRRDEQKEGVGKYKS